MRWVTFRSKIIAGFGTGLTILVLVGLFSYLSMVQTNDDRAWVTHTHLVLEQLDAVLTNLLEAQAGQRGYLLTGETFYLEPYNFALAHVNQNLAGLRLLTADNAVQQRSLDRLDPLIATMLDELRRRMELRMQRGLAAGAESVRRGTIQQHTDQIRSLIADMRGEENRLLKLRSEKAVASSRTTKIAIVIGDALGIAFLGFAAILAGQEMERRRRANELIRQLNAGLEQRVAERTAELAERAKDLARSNAELQQFAYVASHDLQEPLRMVASFTQLLAKRYEGKLDGDAQDFINYAVDGANRMQTLISDLLNYSRVGTQGKPLAPTDCDVLLNRVLEGIQLAIEESGAVISRGPLPVVLADSQQLGQLLQNLLANAIKFRGEKAPRIHISAEKKEANWQISVRDNGIGISPEHASRIFVIFQRLHTKTEYPGTGIGLAICKKIVDRHGGRIWVEPSPGGGSTFYFTMPAAAIQKPEEKQRNEIRIPATAR